MMDLPPHIDGIKFEVFIHQFIEKIIEDTFTSSDKLVKDQGRGAFVYIIKLTSTNTTITDEDTKGMHYLLQSHVNDMYSDQPKIIEMVGTYDPSKECILIIVFKLPNNIASMPITLRRD